MRLIRSGRLAEADLVLFNRWAETHSPLADAVLPRMTRAANRSMLWIAVAGVMVASRDDRARRAAARGIASIAVTSAMVNGPAKWVFRRTRPPIDLVPVPRRLARQPVSASFPSGHSASAAAFATAVGLEWPALAAPLGLAALGVAWSRVHTGVHYPSDCAAGMAIGVGSAVLVRRRWPTAPVAPAVAYTAADVPALPDGEGLVAVVNTASGSRDDVTAALRERLPAAEIVEVCEDDDVCEVLAKAAERAQVLGVAGGDGTVSAAAETAAQLGRPLLVLPCGTLNHFARQLGVTTLDAAVEALATGTAASVDVGDAGGLPFVNTASIGGYTKLVLRRERLERVVGKWPAMALSLVTLVTDRPITVEIDGRPMPLWLLFCGNGRYVPPGLAPTWRARLDGGVVDVRVVRADRRFARLRVVAAALLRRLPRCPAYGEWSTSELDVRVQGDPVPLARDGEVGDPVQAVTFASRRGALVVYRGVDVAEGAAG